MTRRTLWISRTIDGPAQRNLSPSFLLPLLLLCGFGGRCACGQTGAVVVEDGRTARHATPEWGLIVPHLPDMKTATPERLTMAGDVLRARRFPEDALDYYRSALARGGDQATMLNRIGVTELELQHLILAQIDFKRVVKLQPKIADGWNNLGATEYLQRDYGKAIKDYKKAAHLDDGRASYRSNLGTAYFEVKDYKRARKQFEAALALDPEVFTRAGAGGVTAHILSPEDRARFYFEMAKMSISHADEAGMLHWLEKAAETGFDVRAAIDLDPQFATYRADPRVEVLIHNGLALNPKQTAGMVGVERLPVAGSAAAAAAARP